MKKPRETGSSDEVRKPIALGVCSRHPGKVGKRAFHPGLRLRHVVSWLSQRDT